MDRGGQLISFRHELVEEQVPQTQKRTTPFIEKKSHSEKQKKKKEINSLISLLSHVFYQRKLNRFLNTDWFKKIAIGRFDPGLWEWLMANVLLFYTPNEISKNIIKEWIDYENKYNMQPFCKCAVELPINVTLTPYSISILATLGHILD